MSVTIVADGFKPEDLPSEYQPPAPSRRQARYDKWRFAGTVVTLNPDGVKVRDALLTLTPHTDASIGKLKSNEKMEIFAWNVETQAWEYAPGSTANIGTVSATLSHFSAYVAVITELGDAVTVPPPAEPPIDEEPKSRGMNGGEIAAAVIFPLLAVAAACYAFYWYQYKRDQKPRTSSPKPTIESEIGYDDSAAVPARITVAPAEPAQAAPDTTPDTTPPPAEQLQIPAVLQDEWYKCTGCESPIKSSWPRCPTCRTTNKGGQPMQFTADAIATAEQNQSAPVQGAGVRELPGAPKDAAQENPKETVALAEAMPVTVVTPPPLGEAASDKALQDFTGVCPQCAAPVKGTWNKCPGCQVPLGTQEVTDPGVGEAKLPADLGAVPGFFGSCHQCAAPVKSGWKRCPGCKAKVIQPGEQSLEVEKPPTYTPDGAASAIMAVKTEEFTAECSNQDCRAPVKSVWKRCPTCKTPIAKSSDGAPPPQTAPKPEKKKLSSLQPLPAAAEAPGPAPAAAPEPLTLAQAVAAREASEGHGPSLIGICVYV